jgi:hypothetical protein
MMLYLTLGTGGSCIAQDISRFTTTASRAFKVLRFQGNFVRWERTRDDAGPDITYKVVTGSQTFGGARNCRAMTAVDDLLAGSGVERSTLDSELASAFSMWALITKLTFRHARADEPADILIGAQVDPAGWAFADVFYDATSPRHIKPITQALICLNPDRQWKVGFDGNLKAYDLRYTFAHEIGHAIGLDHPVDSGQIMYYRYNERFRDLQAGDVLGATTLYGAPLGSNPSLGSNPTTSLACCRNWRPRR